MNFTQSLVYDDEDDGDNDFVGFLQKQKLLGFIKEDGVAIAIQSFPEQGLMG